jgi:serine/threonine protein kinase
MANGSLQNYIVKPISEHERLKLVIDLFESQQAFYDKKILHHDIKSDNALVDKDGRLQAIDTGEADYVNHYSQYLRGAPNFRSPEKIGIAAAPTYLEKGGLGKVAERLRKDEINLEQALEESKNALKAVGPDQADQKANLEKANQVISQVLLGKSGEFSAALLAHEILHTRPGSKSTHPVMKNQNIRPMSVDALVTSEKPENVANVQSKLFEGKNPKLYEEQPITSTSEHPSFYSDVDRLIWKMLAIDPQDRKSFGEAIKELKEIEKKNFPSN